MRKDNKTIMTKMDEDRQIIWRPIVWCGMGEGGAREGIKDLIDMMDLDISCLSICVPHNPKLYDSILSTNWCQFTWRPFPTNVVFTSVYVCLLCTLHSLTWIFIGTEPIKILAQKTQLSVPVQCQNSIVNQSKCYKIFVKIIFKHFQEAAVVRERVIWMRIAHP